MDVRWRVELFGGLRAVSDERVLTRFKTQKIAALLAYLAYHLDRAHPREVLFELLWPECLPSAGRNNLNNALSSLRHQLEPPGVPQGAVIIADRNSVRLNPATVTTDVGEFEAALQLAERAKSNTDRAQHLADAIERYHGALLAGYYENWILFEQQRLAELSFKALRALLTHLAQTGEMQRAADYALRGVSVNPLREEAHRDLMRLYVAVGQPDAALRHYHEFEQILKREFGDAPDAKLQAATRELARDIPSRVEGSGLRVEDATPALDASIRQPSTLILSSHRHRHFPPDRHRRFDCALGKDRGRLQRSAGKSSRAAASGVASTRRF